MIMCVKNRSKILIAIFIVGIGFFAHPDMMPAAASPSCGSGIHFSSPSTAPSFDAAYRTAPPTSVTAKEIKGIQVNHHLLAGNLIAATIEKIKTNTPITVVLISPNHFGAGSGPVLASADQWQTPYGVLHPNCEAIATLLKTAVVRVEEEPFIKEHGISGIVPFIKKSLPHATIIPIMVRNTLTPSDQDRVARALDDILGDHGLVINSVDFSHYLPDQAAQFHDEMSLAVLKDFDYTSLAHIEANSIAGTGIFLHLMQHRGAEHVDVVANTNSAKLTSSPDLEETTSYIDALFSVGPKRGEPTATILAFGDLMLDRGVREQIERHGPLHPFERLQRLLMGEDIVVANAEGPFTDEPSVSFSNPSVLRFTFATPMLPTLKNLGFTLLGQANNHALDFGARGLAASRRAIERAGMKTFGDPTNRNPGPVIVSIRGTRVAFIGYHQFTGTGDGDVLSAITRARHDADVVIVVAHWGVEYAKTTTPFQREHAHRFIDAGADLVLGAHPHVIEPIEIYKQRAIFYSLGNFIFDQGSRGPTAQGLAIGIVIKPTTITYTLLPIAIRNSSASLMPNNDRTILLNSVGLHTIGSLNHDQTKDIAAGAFTLSRTPL